MLGQGKSTRNKNYSYKYPSISTELSNCCCRNRGEISRGSIVSAIYVDMTNPTAR